VGVRRRLVLTLKHEHMIEYLASRSLCSARSPRSATHSDQQAQRASLARLPVGLPGPPRL